MRTTLDISDTMYRRIKTRTTPSWFGSVKVNASVQHDMASVRESITRHHGELRMTKKCQLKISHPIPVELHVPVEQI